MVHSEIRDPKSKIPPRAVVISFDRWHIGFIGCYGNDWIETPNLDRLATQAVVFDQHFAENIDPTAANHAWWTGAVQFPLDEEQQRACPTWIDDLHARGIATQLIVESDGRDDTTVAPPFGRIVTARGTDGFEVAEQDTPFARTVREVERWLKSGACTTQPAVLWIKSRGVPAPWIPPRAFGELYLEEFGLASQGESRREPDEPSADDAPEGEETPDREDTEEEPAPVGVDESLDWRYGAAMYAAYVTLLDRWLGKLLQILETSPEWNGALLIVTAGAGQALGEHGRIADERSPLRAESVHAPLFLRVPGTDQEGTRRQAIVQTIDVAPTLLDWFSDPADSQYTEGQEPVGRGRSLLSLIRNEVAALRDVAWMGSGRLEWGLRTVDFFYAEPGDGNPDPEPPPAVLFEKPHDNWDQFDVAPQFRQVTEDMHGMLNWVR
ncbi:MAG: sulfatase-like hydrolase/transferase [Planctomycetia bacterium]|nr:sulfatase-like hydrolase/transferase [Planctomycetia bacterium]